MGFFRYLAPNPNNRGSNAYRKYLGLSQSQLDTLVVKFIEQNMDSEYQSSSLRKADLSLYF